MNPLRRRIEVTGKVQGVGFRWFAQEEARRLGLGGWVANTDRGSVVVEAEGATETLDSFEEILRRGPSAARVASLTSHEMPPRGENDFGVSLRW